MRKQSRSAFELAQTLRVTRKQLSGRGKVPLIWIKATCIAAGIMQTKGCRIDAGPKCRNRGDVRPDR